MGDFCYAAGDEQTGWWLQAGGPAYILTPALPFITSEQKYRTPTKLSCVMRALDEHFCAKILARVGVT